MIKRIGFACKWIDNPSQVDGIKPKDEARAYNTGTTTITWLNKQDKDAAEQRLWDLMVHNIESTKALIQRVGELDDDLRMVRISSDILPVYTEPTWQYYWRLPDVQAYLERNFGPVGDLARRLGVRLSFHPGQFCVLASDRQDVVDRSIEEFEYHVDMARWMGYGKQFQDIKINVHISGRAGPEGIRRAYTRLSPEARNSLTIENEEMTHDLHTVLEIADLVPIVLDIHHHWVNSGEYIEPTDDRVKKVIDSWRGIRPTCHYSVSREDVLVSHPSDQRPARDALMESGHNKQKLRAHSDYYWNDAVNDWAMSFNDQFDIMCESKAKNLASQVLYDKYVNV